MDFLLNRQKLLFQLITSCVVLCLSLVHQSLQKCESTGTGDLAVNLLLTIADRGIIGCQKVMPKARY